MALIDVYSDYADNTDSLNDTLWIYNVSFAVGPGAPNLQEDVALVQQLLQPISAVQPLLKNGATVQVDGSFGRQTAEAISAFQKWGKRLGANIATDGRIDPAHGGFGSISHTRYTIHFLNDQAYKHRPWFYGSLEAIDTRLPPVLWRIKARGVAHAAV